MPTVTCVERTSEAKDAQDAAWVANGVDNRLFYPYVSSCVTVTLVFDNGILGGHASQSTADAKHPELKPAENLLSVIDRMVSAAPASGVRGSFKKIYFIGTTSDAGWKLDKAKDVIIEKFGQPSVTVPGRTSASPVDIVFDTEKKKIYSAIRADHTHGADQTIQDAKAIMAAVKYD